MCVYIFYLYIWYAAGCCLSWKHIDIKNCPNIALYSLMQINLSSPKLHANSELFIVTKQKNTLVSNLVTSSKCWSTSWSSMGATSWICYSSFGSVFSVAPTVDVFGNLDQILTLMTSGCNLSFHQHPYLMKLCYF